MNRSLLILTTIALIASAPAQAQTITQAEAITRLLSAPEVKAEWFSPEFLAQAPFESIAAQLRSVNTTYGKFVRLETLQDYPLAVYERGTLVILAASLDSQRRLTAFGIGTGPASMSADPAAAVVAQAKEAALLEKLFKSEPLDLSLISPSFLEQVSAEDLTKVFTDIRTESGALEDVQNRDGGYLLTFEKGQWEASSVGLDTQDRLTGLLLRPAGADATQGNADEAITQLESLFKADVVDMSRFSPEFLTQAPADDIRAMFASIRADYGTIQSVKPQGAGWRLTFKRGALDLPSFKVDDQGLISSLFLRPVTPDISYSTLADARAAFAALPGQVNLLVQEAGTPQPLVDLNSKKLLAVGSTFKLAILGELQAQVTRGEKQWSDEVTLTDADKSLPSGTLQNAPTGGTYQLRDLAARMISVSDNTATDLLLKAVGRKGVEARLGQTAMPSTREAFVLKDPANIELLRAYRSAGLDRDARREVLKKTHTLPLPNVGVFAQGKTLAQDVEWFVSAQRLCRLMADVAELPETWQNPGVAAPADFSDVSFKGGSEPGVLNFTTQVTTKAGKTLCVSATWNRPEPVDESQFAVMYAGVLKLLR